MKIEIKKIRTKTLRGLVYDLRPQDKAQRATCCSYSSLELHISPNEYYWIIVFIFIATTQPFNFFYNYEWLQLFTSYLTIHLLTFCIQYIIRTLHLSNYYYLQLWITLHCLHWNACHYLLVCNWFHSVGQNHFYVMMLLNKDSAIQRSSRRFYTVY
jgi:hypothetical protein